MEDEISWSTHPPRLIYEYLLRGESGVSRVAETLHRKAESEPGGKFSKAEAGYLPLRPFPLVLWDNICGRCRFWHEGGPGEPGRCHIVGREGDKYGGEAIHPRGWCGFYTPPENERAFAWIRDRIEPSGSTDVRGEYEPAITRKTKARQSERPLPRRNAVEMEENPVTHGASSGGSDSSMGDEHE